MPSIREKRSAREALEHVLRIVRETQANAPRLSRAPNDSKVTNQFDDAFEKAIEIAKRRQMELLLGSVPCNRVAGTVEHHPRGSTFRLMDDLENEFVIEHEHGHKPVKWSDPQIVPSVSDESGSSVGTNAPIEHDLRALVYDEKQPARSRLDALLAWEKVEPELASGFVAAELSKALAPPEWRNALVIAADAVRFEDANIRQQVCTELMRIARSMRDSQSQDDRPVVLCAIHRAASMIPQSRVGEFEEFLRPGSAIDTRLATLQAIVRIFEAEPPDSPVQISGVADRAATLAAKRWDVDVFAAGEFSALAIEGTITVAVLGDDRLETLLDDAVSLGKSWVTRKLTRRLTEVRGFRVSRGVDVSALDRAIEKLKNGGHRDVGGSE